MYYLRRRCAVQYQQPPDYSRKRWLSLCVANFFSFCVISKKIYSMSSIFALLLSSKQINFSLIFPRSRLLHLCSSTSCWRRSLSLAMWISLHSRVFHRVVRKVFSPVIIFLPPYDAVEMMKSDGIIFTSLFLNLEIFVRVFRLVKLSIVLIPARARSKIFPPPEICPRSWSPFVLS